MDAENDDNEGSKVTSVPGQSPNRPRRKRDLCSVYPVDEDGLLLEAVDKFLLSRGARDPARDFATPVTASDDSSLSPRSDSPVASFGARRSPPPPGALSSDSDAKTPISDGGSLSLSLSQSSPLSEPESAYFGDDSDTSARQREVAGAGGGGGGGSASSGTELTSAHSDLSEDDFYGSTSGAPSAVGDDSDSTTHRSRPRTIRSACFFPSTTSAAAAETVAPGDGDDHNYSLASRCSSSRQNVPPYHHHHHHHHHHRRNPWRKARDSSTRDEDHTRNIGRRMRLVTLQR